MRDFDSMAVIEALRSGISSRRLSAIFTYGREGRLEQVMQLLDSVAAGNGQKATLIKGDFGEGKTHFLNNIFNHALGKNFVVSFVVLSKETPFSRLDRVYPKIVGATYLPGAVEPGIEMLLRDVRPGSDLAGRLLAFADQELHPKLYYVLKNYLEAGDTYQQHLLIGDLSGEWLPVSSLKSLHKLNMGKSVKIAKFSAKDHVWDYFRLLANLIKSRGYAGWVILFDEFELVGTLGAMSRADAYCNLGKFLFPQDRALLPATYAVFSISARFWEDRLLNEKHPDFDIIPSKLNSKGAGPLADLVKRALNALLQDVISLESLSSSEVEKILLAVRDLHAKAYDWQPDFSLERVMAETRQNRLRTKIRYALEYLDLEYLYQCEPQLRAQHLDEAALDEVAATRDTDDEI